jgi:hypothetical protein
MKNPASTGNQIPVTKLVAMLTELKLLGDNCCLFMWMLVLCTITPYGLVGRCRRFGETYCPEDGGIMFLRNIGIYLQNHTSLQRRRPTSTYSSP